MKNTKKSLLLSVVSMLLCFSMLLGTSWAWFTDSVSSGSNVIKSGNLDLDVQYTLDGKTWNDLDGAKDLFQKGLWEPGHTEVVALKITNKGSLALKYEASMNIIKETIGKNKDGGNIVLSEILTVSTLTFAEAGVDPLFGFNIAERSIEEAFKGENNLAYNAPVAFKAGNVLQDDKQLLPGEAHYVVVKVDMPETVGNEANHDSKNAPKIEFGINVLATQSPYESDSFDNQYDKDATFEDLADTNVLASSTKTLSEGADSIDFALYSKGIRIAKLTVPASAIADTTKPVKVIIDGIDPSEEAMADESTQAYAYDIKVTNLKSGLTGDQLVTVVVAAPNALAAMKAYHNGELIEDAVYDEVAGTITFKTASFSPFDFTSKVENVENLDQLRAALQKEGTTAKLIGNIIVDLTKDTGAARNPDYIVSGYYNGVMINGKNVGLDLNGHNITAFCGDQYNSNSDVGALFFVGKEGSLNITNTGAVETGFIKMKSSIYAVWAPYAYPSYVDIYGGAFIADYYAGDTVGTPLGSDGKYDRENGTMSITQENSNRSIIYAGYGGNINVYGGYFLYNNTINDKSNRNNGAFNAKDYYEAGALITIHEGVYLSNKEYRQNPYRNPETNPSFDDYSIKLADEELYQVSKVELDEAVKIDGKDYSTWYQVSRAFKYKVTFKNADGTEDLDTYYALSNDTVVEVEDIDDTARGKLDPSYTNDFGGWTNAASDSISTIDAGNTKDIVLYPVHSTKYTVTWLDEDGNVLNAVTTSGNNPKYSSVKAYAPTDTDSRYTDLVFSHWEVRTVVNGEATSVEITDSYQIKSNISLYPVYVYNGSLDLIAVDTDGDGVANYYAVSGSDLTNSPDFIIPADVNGIPVQEIRTGAFADGNLRDVVIPNSVNYIGKNAFCANGTEFPQIQIIFEGTRDEWDDLPKDGGWDDNIGSNSVIICTEEDPIGYYNQAGSNGFWGLGASINWKWVSGTPDWYPRNYD